MPRIQPIDREHAPADVASLLDGVEQLLGGVPNLFATVAQSPAGLRSLVSQINALGAGTLDGRTRELVALSVAGANHCDYCASAHTALGQMAKVPPAELAQALQSESPDRRVNAALRFVKRVLESRGQVSDVDLLAVKAAGWTDGQVVELVAHVALNVFTNYLNGVAQTEIDFPPVSRDSMPPFRNPAPGNGKEVPRMGAWTWPPSPLASASC
jgi:uncharacterized peroxidase-related enzyme